MKLKVTQVNFNSTVLIPGFVKNDTSINIAKHKGTTLSMDDRGVIVEAGKSWALIPFSNIKVILFEQVPDADGE